MRARPEPVLSNVEGRSQRILITGGQGQLGRALQAALAGHQLLAPGHQELDVSDRASIQQAIDGFRPEVVLHAAAWTDTEACEADPQRALLVNGEGARLVAEACLRAGAAMLYVSTNEVFDGLKREPYNEDDEPNPLNAYARSKLAGERLVQSVLDRYWIVRTAWLYGPGRLSFPEKIVQLARQQGGLRLVTDEVASPTWTADLAGAIARLVRERIWGVYHLTNSGWCSRLDWAREVLRLAGLNGLPVTPVTQREYGSPCRKPVFSALANVKAAGLGIQLRPWRQALAEHLRRSAGQPGEAAAARPQNSR